VTWSVYRNYFCFLTEHVVLYHVLHVSAMSHVIVMGNLLFIAALHVHIWLISMHLLLAFYCLSMTAEIIGVGGFSMYVEVVLPRPRF